LFCQFEHHVHDFHYLYLPIWALSHACEILSPGLDAVVELQEHRSSEHDSRFNLHKLEECNGASAETWKRR
jgi:hypothetical protein